MLYNVLGQNTTLVIDHVGSKMTCVMDLYIRVLEIDLNLNDFIYILQDDVYEGEWR